jgi:hypothetical protein
LYEGPGEGMAAAPCQFALSGIATFLQFPRLWTVEEERVIRPENEADFGHRIACALDGTWEKRWRGIESRFSARAVHEPRSNRGLAFRGASSLSGGTTPMDSTLADLRRTACQAVHWSKTIVDMFFDSVVLKRWGTGQGAELERVQKTL